MTQRASQTGCHAQGRGKFRYRLGLVASAFAVLGGCATLPSNGPTARQIAADANKPSSVPFMVWSIDDDRAPIFNPAAEQPGSLATILGPAARARDELTSGDVLEVRIYEIGISLFSSGSTAVTSPSSDFSAHSERFNVVVDERGAITLPYLGTLMVAGASLRQAEGIVRRAMVGKSQSPTVLITLQDSPRSNVTVTGAISKPGRVPLTPAGERLLDVIAAAGGSTQQSFDSLVRVTRLGKTHTLRLSEIQPADFAVNIALAPGDRVEVINQPLTFLSFGASNKIAQIPFDSERVTLAEAIAKSGGPNDNLADPRAVFLFRNEPVPGADNKRVIYRLNMMNAKSYFLAQQIYLKDKDLLLVSNARSNVPAKFVSVIGQLFSPLVMVRAATK